MSKAEEFIQENTKTLKESNGKEYFKWLTPEQAIKAIEIAREEMLVYVKYELDLRIPKTLDYNGIQVNREDFIDDFIQAMKDE